MRLTRAALNQIYLSYVRPILEYSSIVWDGCSASCSDSIDKLQNEAARIVTGLTRSVSLENLYRECGWETLSARRKIFKLCFMYKVSNNLVPHYIEELIPPLVGNRSQYQLRDSQNYENIHTRTNILQKSCIPSSISLWNNLEQEIRSSSTYSSFKSKLYDKNKQVKISNIYCVGNRYISVLHARLRNNCSHLNEDLYINHLRLDPMCDCYTGVENAEHYFFKCHRYSDFRISLFRATREFHPLNINKLLFGSADLTFDQNCLLFEEVQTYIKNTKRFK